MASEFLACEETDTEGGASVSGDGLDVDIFEAAAKFERADQEDVEKDAAGQAERISSGRFAKVSGQCNDGFLEDLLRAASDVGSERRIELRAGLRQSGFAIEARRKD